MKLTDPAIFGATLKDLLRTDRERMLSESGYLKARLSDREPHATREISLLVESQPAGVAGALRANPPTASLRNSLTSKLQNERGFSAEAANWVVDCWASALDVTFVADPPKDKQKPPVKAPAQQPTSRPAVRNSSSIAGPLLLVFLIWVRPWNAVSYTKAEGFHWNQEWHLPWTDPKPIPVFPKIDPTVIPEMLKIDPNNPALQPLTGSNSTLQGTGSIDPTVLETPNLIDSGKCWFQIGTDVTDKCAMSNMKGWDGREPYIGASEILLERGKAAADDIQGEVGKVMSVAGPGASCKPAGMWYGTPHVLSGAFPDGVSMSSSGLILGQPKQAGDSTVTLAMDKVTCNGKPYYGLQQTLNFHIETAEYGQQPR